MSDEHDVVMKKTRRLSTMPIRQVAVGRSTPDSGRSLTVLPNRSSLNGQPAAPTVWRIGPRQRSLLGRLRRIEGQARGIHRMVEDRCDHAEVVAQLRSMEEAVRSAIHELLQDRLDMCATASGKRATEDMLRELLALIRRYDP